MTIEAAIALYEQGAFADAGARFAQTIPAAPNDLRPWKYLALCFIAQGQPARAIGLVDMRQQQAGDGVGLFFDVVEQLALARKNAQVEALAAGIPANNVLGIVIEYFRGWLAAPAEPERALAYLRTAAVAAQQCGGLFERDDHLRSIVSQGFVLSDFADLDRLSGLGRDEILRAAPSLEPSIDLATAAPPAPGSDFAYLTSCNELYLERFGAPLVDALDRCGVATVLHLHIVDPTAATPGRIAALRQRARTVRIGYSTERFRHAKAGGYRSASYYACARFLRAGDIAAHYARDLLILDMDTDALADVPALAAAMREAELGYFSCGDIQPWLMCRAAVVYVRRSAATALFTDVMLKYIASKVEEQGFWGLDQAALYVVSRYLRARHPPFRIVEFSERLGTTLAAFARSETMTEEKRALRRANTGAAAGDPAVPRA
jgi:hypothetical protein